MNILSLDDVRMRRDATVFRQSVRAGLVASAGFVAASAGVAAAGLAGYLPWFLAGVIIGVLLAFALLSGLLAWRSAHPHNWLLALDGDRLLINLRSYLNVRFPTTEPCVIELSHGQIAGVRKTVSRHTGLDAANDATRDRTVFLDIIIRDDADLDEVSARLDAERELRDRGGAWRHYPVTRVNGSTLRLEWRGKHARVSPGIDHAIRVLGAIAPPLAPETGTIDFGGPAHAPKNASAEREVRALARQGRIVEATLLARRSLRLSTTEARQYVDSVAANLLPHPGTEDDARQG